MKLSVIFLTILLLFCGCSIENPASQTDLIYETKPSKSQLFVNGKIYTVNEKQPWAEAILVENGVIKFVGSNDEAKKIAAKNVETIDLKGKMMLPGIHDVHTHPLEAMSDFAGTCELDSQETDAENFIEILNECKDEQLATNWVLGSGHSVFTLLDAKRPPVEILDEAIPDRPAVIMEETSHSIWVNSKALALAKIDRNTPNPQGGVIVKDKKTGKPTGILFDAAGDMVMDLAWLPTKEIKELNYQGLLKSLKEMNKFGITSVIEGRTYWKREFQDAWLRAEKENKLTVRAILSLWAYPLMNDNQQIAKLKTLYRNNPNDLVRVSQIKVYSDGILINSTAAMLEPYKKTLGEIPSKNGLNYFTEERMTKYVAELEKVGFDFHIHAIGDRGVREALNAIEKSQTEKGRHRLTHLEVINQKDFSRFKKSNITADIQVAGDFTNPKNWKENEFLIGDRTKNFIPLKSLFDAGARITLSSDWDVSGLNPFVGMQNALTRNPQNLSDLQTVIKAYTLNAAYTMRQETTVGSIEVGKQADLIVIDQNLFEIPVNQISKTKVLQSFLKGEKVYQAN
jgi:predicted amidohydrolase YtcJ